MGARNVTGRLAIYTGIDVRVNPRSAMYLLHGLDARGTVLKLLTCPRYGGIYSLGRSFKDAPSLTIITNRFGLQP
jgi:hypothetical protein